MTCRLACRRRTIVATVAASGDTRMIKDDISPAAGRVAIITFSGRHQVLRMLAGGGDAVMTAATGCRDTGMVEAGVVPVAGVMTVITFGIGRDMLWVFTGGYNTVMT